MIKTMKGAKANRTKEDAKKAIEEWKKAKAVKATDEEVQKVIDGKLRDRLHRQYGYREAYLIRVLKQERLLQFKKKLDSVKGTETEMDWQGTKMHPSIAEAEFDLDMFYYKRAVMNEEHLRKALKNDGMTDQEILGVLSGCYKKEWKDGRIKDDE